MDQTSIREFIGSNSDYYLKQWQTTDIGGRAYTWNWAAFFFSILWCSYRKMYGVATFFSFLLMILLSLQYIFAPMLVYRIVMLVGLAAVIAYFGNSMYRSHVEQSLQEIAIFNPDKTQYEGLLRSLGGVDLRAALLNLVGLLVALYIVLTIFNVIPSAWQFVTIVDNVSNQLAIAFMKLLHHVGLLKTTQ